MFYPYPIRKKRVSPIHQQAIFLCEICGSENLFGPELSKSSYYRWRFKFSCYMCVQHKLDLSNHKHLFDQLFASDGTLVTYSIELCSQKGTLTIEPSSQLGVNTSTLNVSEILSRNLSIAEVEVIIWINSISQVSKIEQIRINWRETDSDLSNTSQAILEPTSFFTYLPFKNYE
jgi:hypothetical protein